MISHTHTFTYVHVNTHLLGYSQNNRDFFNLFLSLGSFQSTGYKIEVRKIMGPLGNQRPRVAL